VASSLSPLFSGFPPLSKKPGRSFVPFFLLPRSDSPRLGLVRNALPAAPSAHHFLSFSNLQLRPAPTQHLSITLPFLIVLPTSVSPTQSAALTTSFVPRHYPPVETLASAAAAGTIGLLETPQSQLHFRQFHNHLLTSARDALKHPHSERSTDWQLNSTFSTFQLRSKAISHIPPPPHTNWSKQVGRLSNYETRQGLEVGGRE